MGEQVRVDVFYERFPLALQRVIEVIGGLLLLAMGLYIAWLTLPSVEQSSTNLKLEERFDDRLVSALATAGHDVEVLPEAFSDTMGHAGGIVRHPDGLIESAHDPRSNGGAASV